MAGKPADLLLVDDTPELPRDERIKLAIKKWRELKGALSQRTAARKYSLGNSTLNDYIKLKRSSVVERQQGR